MRRKNVRVDSALRIKGLSLLENPKIYRVIIVIMLVSTIALGAYLRLVPALNSIANGYTLYLDELDPYEAYYIVKYMLEKGPLSYYELKPPNPAAMLFWYPWGRDFTKTELPGLMYTIYFTYLPLSVFGVRLMDYMVIFPVIATVISLIGIFLAARELSRSSIAAVIATAFFATVFADRTLAGFTVKYTMALMILPYTIYMFAKAYKSMKLRDFLILGVIISYMAVSSGLYIGTYVVVYLTLIITPILFKNIDDRRLFINTLAMSIPILISFLATPLYGLDYLDRNLGLISVAGFTILGIKAYILNRFLGNRSRLAYTLLVIGGVASGVAMLLTGIISVSGKAALALGITYNLGPLPFTVAEYQPLDPTRLMSSYGVLTILSILSIIYNIYLLIAKKDLASLYVSILLLVTLYVLFNISYFLSYAVLIMAIASSTFIALLVSVASKLFIRSRYSYRKPSIIGPMIAIALLLLFIPAQIYTAYTVHIPAYGGHLPMILTSGIGGANPSEAWIDALEWIRENTTEDSVIVAWWDYGYWISVLGQRPSIADGSTINGTQISILAKILTTNNETEAARMLIESFRVKPNKTYILVYDAFAVDKRGTFVIPVNLADAAKGISAIFRIAGYDIDYDIYGNNPPTPENLGKGPQRYVKVQIDQARGIVRIQPNWGSPDIYTTLLYGIMSNGLKIAFPNTVTVMQGAGGGAESFVPAVPFKYFKPAAVFKSRFLSDGNFDYFVVVFIFKLVSDPRMETANQ